MPSLARKSIKFMRDVYNIAANPDGSSVPAMPAHSQGFQPSQGLSGQFTQTYAHQRPPLPSNPTYPANSSYGYSYGGPQQSQPPQPYASWNVPPTPVSPLSSQPEHTFLTTTNSSSNSIPAFVLPLSPPASVSPSTPQLYHDQQQFAVSPPPLPQRPSLHGHSPSWQGSSEPVWQSQSQLDTPITGHNAHEYNQTPQQSIQPLWNAQHTRHGSYHGHAEAESTRPSPPPLPPRMQTHNPDRVPVPDQWASVPHSTSWPYPSHESYLSAPNLSSTTQLNAPECHEMAADSISGQPPVPQHQHADISSLAELPELPGTDQGRITPPPSRFDTHPASIGSPAGNAVELPASPIRRTSRQPTHQSHISRPHSQGHTIPVAEELESTPTPTSAPAPLALSHRDLGVALPPSTLKTPAYLSLSQSRHSDSDTGTGTTMPSPTPPSPQTPPSNSPCPDEPPDRGHLQPNASETCRHDRDVAVSRGSWPGRDAFAS
ncbi:hypothetical protein A1O7_07316 [Cladophialophora yegresii CBS 114405]|uniref:Uncharacterized protein n=1 Tax=Cladophialophora yegresii CBS 114405 TaxID=1182544 RepID=W9VMQ4_9EURO|nr:uncharacterized protein A1O7_07316 [Cladophialophora yegresii CBS 114405]EXJ56972.1 hypothetical protein A1O7_07316 [Cladophialophora yegresii CBS 114405]